jgi:hypothetical protein
MAYGSLKVDNIIFTNGGVDQTITVSGIVAATSGNLTVTGTISGNVVQGGTLVSGATVTGGTGQFTTLTGETAGFTTVTGITVTGTTANFTSGVFTTQISGATVTGNSGQFTNIVAGGIGATTITGTTVTGTTANFASGVFTTQLSGATVTGTTANFTSGNFTNISGGTHTITSGVFAAGSATNPSISFTSDPNSGLFSPGADQVAISTNGTGRLFVDASGNVGLGTASPSVLWGRSIKIQGISNAAVEITEGTVTTALISAAGSFGIVGTSSNHPFYIRTNNTERLRVTADGKVGLGTSTPQNKFAVVSSGVGYEVDQTSLANTNLLLSYDRAASTYRSVANYYGGTYIWNDGGTERMRLTSTGLGIGTTTPAGALDVRGTILGLATDNATTRTLFLGPSDYASSGKYLAISWSHANQAAEYYTQDAFPHVFFVNNGERARIDSSGRLLVGTTNSSPATSNVAGTRIGETGQSHASADSAPALIINRKTNDGGLVDFLQDGTFEGSISVSGTTVSYNGAHLSRWSQLPGGAERAEILRGTVLSNIDEMCTWGEEDNEQLNRMKVSDVEGDKNVSGVFQSWDDDDDAYTDDFYCAMTGDFIIRIAEGVTVQRGDLLMSAGDGTAKPQDDDIIRSKTIAKVTSTHVTCTYDDGSYCVPCVLMAC